MKIAIAILAIALAVLGVMYYQQGEDGKNAPAKASLLRRVRPPVARGVHLRALARMKSPATILVTT